MPVFFDDKSAYCIPFILERLKIHQEQHAAEAEAPPFFIGMNGVQGAGKTTLVTTLAKTLSSPPHSLPTAILSVDDLYFPHEQLIALAQSNPTNPLVQHRGEPSTHDIPLAKSVFASLRSGLPTKIPQYDKSAFHGQGDRVEVEKWEILNEKGEQKVKVIVFEGWCVGFRALGKDKLRQKWEDAVKSREAGDYKGRLGLVKLDDVEFIDKALESYDDLTNQFDAFIHIDAEDTQYVYQWRLDQEVALRASRGMGMTDEQVMRFVDGYYPGYELYTDQLRAGVFKGQSGRQLRLTVGRDRRVKEAVRI